jgi:hypothetical protein
MGWAEIQCQRKNFFCNAENEELTVHLFKRKCGKGAVSNPTIWRNLSELSDEDKKIFGLHTPSARQQLLHYISCQNSKERGALQVLSMQSFYLTYA